MQAASCGFHAPHKLGPRVLSHWRCREAPHCPPSSSRRRPSPPFLSLGGFPFGRQCRPTVAGYGGIRRTNRLQIRGGRTPWRGSSSASPRFPFFHSEMNPSSLQSVALELTTEMDVRSCSTSQRNQRCHSSGSLLPLALWIREWITQGATLSKYGRNGAHPSPYLSLSVRSEAERRSAIVLEWTRHDRFCSCRSHGLDLSFMPWQLQ